jgi:hypothetical protein
VVWSSQLIFYGRLPATEVDQSGWYRLSFQVRSLKKPKEHGVWGSVRTGECSASAPLLNWVGAFEADEEPKVVTMLAWISKGHMVEIRPLDRTLRQAGFAGGQAANGEGGRQNVPGIAIDWLKMERVHRNADQGSLRELLIGNLTLKTPKGKSERFRDTLTVVSSDPKVDLRNLVQTFARRAFRRPVDAAESEKFVQLAVQTLEANDDFVEALRVAYRAILCAPRFVYLNEPKAGPLDDYSIATRLSYFLWNRPPDRELLDLAHMGHLRQPETLDVQVERMLRDPRSQNFVSDFASQWLELSQIDFTEPDRKLYSDFDIVVQNSMLDETHRFLQHLLDKNLSVRQLIDSNFTFMNSRLARYYELPELEDDTMRRVKLSPKDHRGGLLTQGAILKVTANGTNTSPVLRGVWVANRILGEDIPPPPENVPAIEPDIRGATTIREQLEKHRSDKACAACHSKIDAAGFALENFDAAGRWRDHYLKSENGKLKPGTKIDSSYALNDGRKFEGLQQFQNLVISDPKKLARNFAGKLLAYGTGCAIQFADRPALEQIVARVEAEDYGVRSVIREVVKSPIFLMK